jgi:hypothetical protein
MSFIREFGKSRAAESLAMILEELGDQKAKVSKILSSFNFALTELEKVDVRIGPKIVQILLTQYVISLDCLDGKVRSFTENLLRRRYRIWMKRNQGYIANKRRVQNEKR